MRPKRFFVTSGFGESDSSLLAFDLALKDAGVEACNLVPVSSIIPKGCRRVCRRKPHSGEITFVVLSRSDGRAGQTVSAGLAVCSTDSYGLVAEHSGRVGKETLKKALLGKVREMALARGFAEKSVELVVRSARVVKRNGCAVSLVVFVL